MRDSIKLFTENLKKILMLALEAGSAELIKRAKIRNFVKNFGQSPFTTLLFNLWCIFKDLKIALKNVRNIYLRKKSGGSKLNPECSHPFQERMLDLKKPCIFLD